MVIAIGLIIILFILLLYVSYKRTLYQSYYRYADKEWKSAEALIVKKDEELKRETQNLKNKLDEIAYMNPITHIYNMDYFIEQGDLLLSKETGNAYTVITFSIANMSKINYTFGTREADKVVYYIAQKLKEKENHHLYAHLQSNLFGVLMENAIKLQIQDEISLITQWAKEYSTHIDVELAFGIYTSRTDSDNTRFMIDNTIVAQKFVDMKECNYKYYNEDFEAQFIENKRMSEEMQEAMDNHKFIMYLQPIVDLKSFQITSAEGLVRWEYPGRGLLSPYAFLPIFEATTVIKKLDYYMWEEACRSIRRWMDNNIEPVPISVNVSPLHLQDDKFIDVIIGLLDKYLIDKNLFILEIPERGLMDSNFTIEPILDTISKKGLRMCIDDFGSLYSPLNLMKNNAIEAIKIDRRFIKSNASSPEGRSLIKYLIAMAKDAELMVITEGVETLEQADYLSKIGSDYGQGYFFSKPISLRAFDHLKKTMVEKIFPVNEFYPTFEQFKQDVDILEQLLSSKGN